MQPTLLATITTRADSRALRIGERAGAVAFATVLTAMAAQISIPLPFTPVPFTFQPMVVLVGAAALGARLGMASQLLYLALGRELDDAAARAQQYVAGAIAHAPGIGHGRGPLNHFWEWRSSRSG